MPGFVKYIEIVFEIAYLISVISLGIIIIKSAKDIEHKLFGYMAIILGAGDAFHLVPRIISNATDTFAQHAVSLGFGEMVTSITMTIFYVFLYRIFKIHYKRRNMKKIDWTIFLLAALRIILVALPQNQWTSSDKPYMWGIYRNIPFVILGIIIVVLFFKESRITENDSYRNMAAAIILSFIFYLIVVLGASTYPSLGMFMLPKTLAYVWIVVMGFKDNKRSLRK